MPSSRLRISLLRCHPTGEKPPLWCLMFRPNSPVVTKPAQFTPQVKVTLLLELQDPEVFPAHQDHPVSLDTKVPAESPVIPAHLAPQVNVDLLDPPAQPVLLERKVCQESKVPKVPLVQ